VKIWKLILSTLVIFAAGVLTGGVVGKVIHPAQREFVALPSPMYQGRVMDRMKNELELTAVQKERIAKIFNESHERMEILWKLINPEVQTELRVVRDKIRTELTPPQREKFELLLKQRSSSRRPDGDRQRRPKPPEAGAEQGRDGQHTNDLAKPAP